MSTILKALRRLEEDKRSQASMSLEEAVVEPERATRRRVDVWVGGAAMAIAGLTALLFATSGVWLPDEDTEPLRVASTPVPAEPPAPAPIKIEDAPRPPPGAPVPLRAPSAENRIEVFANPEDVRDEMRLAAAAPVAEPPEAEEAVVSDVPAAPPVVPSPAPAPPPRATQVAKAPPAPAPASVSAPAPSPPSSDPEPISPERPIAESTVQPVGPVEIIERKPQPDVAVRQISWHPNPDRRFAELQVVGGAGPIRLREGGRIAGFTIAEIGISEVELVRDGVALRRRVGTN